MRAVQGVVQHYAWGDPAAIPELLGVAPDGRPWAELWLGTHPGGPATLMGGQSLRELAGELPYLLKVLAAAEPLSLQTHPDAAQAREGFARENEAGIPFDAPHRVYRDDHAKPELLCALTPFDALCGFRPLGDTEAMLHWLGADHLAAALRHDGLEGAVSGLYRGTIDHREAIRACSGHTTAEAQLVNWLAERYPDDPSIAVTLLLNRVTLQPGQAIFLGPGNLHAYVSGVGVEVMGASDNVVRGGLTPKHVDVDELLRVLRFDTGAPIVIEPVEEQPGCFRYPTADAPFELWRFDISAALPHTASARELVLCTEGDLGTLHHGEAAYLAPGQQIVFSGPSTVFRVTES